jgi:hypothetical protein
MADEAGGFKVIYAILPSQVQKLASNEGLA